MAPSLLRHSALSSITAVVLAICLVGCDQKSTAPTPATPVAVQVRGNAPPTGASSQFIAVAVGADGTEVIVTNQATWQSSNTAIVTVNAGVVQAMAPGNAVVSATYSGVTGSMPLVISTVACAFDLQPAQANIPGDGGSVTIAVNQTQGVNCPWTAQASSFLIFAGPSSGTGSGSVVVAAGFNPTPTRVGTVTVAGASMTISQAQGKCVTSISPATQSAGDAGGSFLIHVAAPTGCIWAASTTATFITLDQRTTTGTQDLLYQVAANPSGNMRQATIAIDQFTLVITQSGPVAHSTLTTTGTTGTTGTRNELTQSFVLIPEVMERCASECSAPPSPSRTGRPSRIRSTRSHFL